MGLREDPCISVRQLSRSHPCPATYRSDCGQVTCLCLSFLTCDLGCHLLERVWGGGNVLLEGLLAEGAWSWCRGLGAGVSPFPSGALVGSGPALQQLSSHVDL